jgi:hypothetical protein
MVTGPTPLKMSFPDGSERSDGSFHLRRHNTYTLKLSQPLSGQFDLVVIRKHYPYAPLQVCPFFLPTMSKHNFEKMAMTHDNITHYGISFVVTDCNALNINFRETSSVLSKNERELKLSYGKAKFIQLLLFSRNPTALLAKADLQVVAEVRPEGESKKRRQRLMEGTGASLREDCEDLQARKKDLVKEICRLYRTEGAFLDINDLSTIIKISKSLINNSIND